MVVLSNSAYTNYSANPLRATREKARHDEAQTQYYAKLEAKIQIAQKLIGLGLPLEQIIGATGLSEEDIKHLVP